MAKDLPVTLDGKVIYHIKLTDSFQGLAEELKRLDIRLTRKSVLFQIRMLQNFMQRL